jgi:hypothetical protein
MEGTFGRIVLGFIAAAISVVIVHQGIIFLLGVTGVLPSGGAWSMTNQIPPFGVPYLLNTIFWGGLWGVVFALVYDRLPGDSGWVKGLIFGLLIVVFSNWILLPLIKGYVFGVTKPPQVLFADFNPTRMLIGATIVGGFGLGLGIIYGLMRPKQAA